MSEASKEVDHQVSAEALAEVLELDSKATVQDGGSSEDEGADITNTDTVAMSSSAKKKKSKKAKLKKAFGVGKKENELEGSNGASNPASKLTAGMVDELLEMNPSLKGEVAGMNKEKAVEILKKLDVADLLTGMVCQYLLRPCQWPCLNLFYIVCERQESKGYGILQILADSACTSIWSVFGPTGDRQLKRG